ncbi:pilus assembly FimT family protein [Vibrio sp. M260118]|uniref:pilus assembly FimT family protein n=1 Tax=Vibrio sp. M260118 TaxID=3020896 RepID=UPI002F43003E
MTRLRISGFTLIELVVVILLVSIISVYAASRYFGSSSVDAHLIESELLSSLRLTQLRAMHRNGFCGRWLVDDSQAAQVSPNTDASNCATSIVPNDRRDSSFVDAKAVGSALVLTTNTGTSYVDFDSLGRPSQCTTSNCQLRWSTTSGSVGVICINIEGGIYAC